MQRTKTAHDFAVATQRIKQYVSFGGQILRIVQGSPLPFIATLTPDDEGFLRVWGEHFGVDYPDEEDLEALKEELAAEEEPEGIGIGLDENPEFEMTDEVVDAALSAQSHRKS